MQINKDFLSLDFQKSADEFSKKIWTPLKFLARLMFRMNLRPREHSNLLKMARD